LKRFAVSLFRATLFLLPQKFRSAYGFEMTEVFASRIGDASRFAAGPLALREIADVAAIAARARASLMWPSLPRATFAAVAGMIIIFTMGRSSDFAPASPSRIDIQAHDPAGQFTLSLVDGRPVAATINRVALPLQLVTGNGDTIRIMGPAGNVALALAYHRESGSIEWKARPLSCRSAPVECDIAQ
jgi:hypothetical protein